MNAVGSRLGTLAALALLLGTLGPGEAGARAGRADDVYSADELGARALTRVAVLPVVAIVDNPDIEHRVEKAWIDFFGVARTQWMAPADVRLRLETASGEPDAIGSSAEAQVWRFGEVNPETAVRLARLLCVDAVLSLRIDRWEIEDGGRGAVAMTAVLTGADGRRLWSVSGLAGHGAGRTSGEGNFTSDLGRVWDPRLEPRDDDRKLGVALYSLLGRWAPALPAAMFEGGVLPRQLADLQRAAR